MVSPLCLGHLLSKPEGLGLRAVSVCVLLLVHTDQTSVVSAVPTGGRASERVSAVAARTSSPPPF